MMTKNDWDKVNARMRRKNQLLSELDRAASEARYGPKGIREIINLSAAINQEKGVS